MDCNYSGGYSILCIFSQSCNYLDGAKCIPQKLTLGKSAVESIFNGLLYNGDRVPVWEAEEAVKVVVMVVSSVNVLTATELYSLKRLHGKLYVMNIFPQ